MLYKHSDPTGLITLLSTIFNLIFETICKHKRWKKQKHPLLNGGIHFFLPEESFKVLRKLSPAGVAWIHCDEDTDRGTKTHILTHEVKPLLLIPYGILNAFHLNTKYTKPTQDTCKTRMNCHCQLTLPEDVSK